MRESLSSNSVDGGENNDTWGCLVDPYIHSHTLSAYTYGHVHISNIHTCTHTDTYAHKLTHRHTRMHVQRNNIKSYWVILCFRKHKLCVHTCMCVYVHASMCVCICVSRLYSTFQHGCMSAQSVLLIHRQKLQRTWTTVAPRLTSQPYIVWAQEVCSWRSLGAPDLRVLSPQRICLCEHRAFPLSVSFHCLWTLKIKAISWWNESLGKF